MASGSTFRLLTYIASLTDSPLVPLVPQSSKLDDHGANINLTAGVLHRRMHM